MKKNRTEQLSFCYKGWPGKTICWKFGQERVYWNNRKAWTIFPSFLRGHTCFSLWKLVAQWGGGSPEWSPNEGLNFEILKFKFVFENFDVILKLGRLYIYLLHSHSVHSVRSKLMISDVFPAHCTTATCVTSSENYSRIFEQFRLPAVLENSNLFKKRSF